MSESLGRGLCGSLNARVDREILELSNENTTLKRARYSVGRRLLRITMVGRSAQQFLLIYCTVLLTTLLAEWAITQYAPCLLPEYSSIFQPGFILDLGGCLIAGQVGVLAIVSVAVAVVTLLSGRDDGASLNTDIRLYYVESYSYELAISGVALLLVLTVQLFWPLNHILLAMGLGGQDEWFRLSLSAIHTLWFCVNLLLFLQFITTTLRFVEPNSRESLRERYSANEVIPRDAKKRLLRTFYMNAPGQLFGEKALKDGPTIVFGYRTSLNEGGTPEIMAIFRAPTKLVDVRLRPLQWALARWHKRARLQPQRQAQFGQQIWNGHIAVAPNFDSVLEGQYDLVIRGGPVPLTVLEKWVIRRCFRFARISSHQEDMPTPDNFLEQLIDKVISQIERGAVTGFRSALDEVIRFHCFLLAAQNTKDGAGNPVNLAEIGGFFIRPDADWVRQYRRAFVAAADKLGNEPSFIDGLSDLVWRLIPEDGLNFSPRVIQALLDLGIHEVIALEDWVTRRAVIGAAVEPGTSSALTGADKRAYGNVLIAFVGSWETLAQTLISSLSLRSRPNTTDANAHWNAFTRGLPVYLTHLRYAAYFLAAAVWNDDALGADRLRDLLLRWLQPFYRDIQDPYVFQNTLLITPDLAALNWPAVQIALSSQVRFQGQPVMPGPLAGVLLWELHCDVVCAAGLVTLHWYATGQQPSSTAIEAAILTLKRQKREGDGSDLTASPPKSVFRLLFDFMIRYALNPRFAEDRYSAEMDGLVRLLTNLAAPRMVSGRVYGGFGIDGVETLRSVLLAAMAANLPVRGDDGVAALVKAITVDTLFASDRSVRNFIWTMQQMVQVLDQAQGDDTYVKAAHAFDRDLDVAAATARLRGELASIVTVFETLRKERLLKAPLDENRMDLVRRRMSEAVMASGPSLTCFRNYDIRRDISNVIPTSEIVFGVMDKGLFTLPEMSAISFGDVPGLFVDVLRQNLSNFVWRDLYHRPKRIVAVDISESTDPFWRAVIAEASTVGPEPILLVPFSGIGEEIGMGRSVAGVLAGVNIQRDRTIPSGGGTGYAATVEGIRVYIAQGLSQEQAVLCSGRLLRTINYGVVHGTDDIADFSFVDGEELERSRIRLRFAQHIEWADNVFVEFALRKKDSDES